MKSKNSTSRIMSSKRKISLSIQVSRQSASLLCLIPKVKGQEEQTDLVISVWRGSSVFCVS